jgi:hypothetical protein
MLPNQNGDHEVNDKLNNQPSSRAPWKVEWSPLKPMFLNCCNSCTLNNVFFKQWYFVSSKMLGEGTLQFNYQMHVMHFMATLFWFFVIPMGDTIFDLMWFSFNPLIVLLLFFSLLLGRTHNTFACVWVLSSVLFFYTMIHIFVAESKQFESERQIHSIECHN